MAKIEEIATYGADPILTANVYCKGRIDTILFGALKPFHDEFIRTQPGNWGFWVMRYRRCGEHLKIRVHGDGDAGAVAQVKEELGRYLQRTVSGIEWPAIAKPDKVTGAADPVIDQQDQADSDYAQGSVVFTGYNRSHVTFGGSPYLEDPHYASLFSSALIAACRYILTNAVPGDHLALAHGMRATLLAELLEAAREELKLKKPGEYFEYHRDWLVRFVLFKAAHTPEEHRRVIDAFDKRIDESSAFWLELSAHTRQTVDDNPRSCQEWRDALRRLMDYVNQLCDQQQHQIDPFARHPSHSALFKVLHGASNQLGLALLDEAMVHHALYRSYQHEELPVTTVAG